MANQVYAWECILTQEEMEAIARGKSPLEIRPDKLAMPKKSEKKSGRWTDG